MPLILLLLALLAPTPVLAQVAGRFPPDSFTNLQVLPKDMPARDLVQMMAGFTRALGIRCSHCHVGTENMPLEQYDFASDEKLLKRKAREMLRMLNTINGTHLASLEERATPSIRVDCFTCHRGTREPRTLQNRLLIAYEAAGIDSTLAAYDGLRRQFHGRAIYDFTEVALADVAGIVSARSLADAERLHELNVRMNPTSVFARLQYVSTALNRTFTESGVDPGIARHTELRTQFGGNAFPQQLLNTLGYTLLRAQQTAQAVAVFRINAEAYPQSPNVHDSLGEALAASGDVQGAIRSYERVLELDPANANATAKLRELRGRENRP